MGNSESKQVSSFGKPNNEFVNKVMEWGCDDIIPNCKKAFKYTLFRWKAEAFGHESVVIVPCPDNDKSLNEQYGSFTIELFVDTSKKEVYLSTTYVSFEKSVEYIRSGKWYPITYNLKKTKHNFNEDKLLVFETISKNFTDLAILLIENHGSYSKYCNNCQTFALGYVELICNQFKVQDYARALHHSATDAERVAVAMSVPIINLDFEDPIKVGINGLIRGSNKNQYNKIIYNTTLKPDQTEKINKLTEKIAGNISSKKAEDLLARNEWDVEKAFGDFDPNANVRSSIN